MCYKSTTIYLLQTYYILMRKTNNIHLFAYYKYKYNENRDILRTEYNIYNVYDYIKEL